MNLIISSRHYLDQFTMIYETESANIELLTDRYIYDGTLDADDDTVMIHSFYLSGNVDITGTGLYANATLNEAKRWCAENKVEYIQNNYEDVMKSITINYNGLPLELTWYDGNEHADSASIVTLGSDPTDGGEYALEDDFLGYTRAYDDSTIVSLATQVFHSKIVNYLRQTMSDPPSYLGIMDYCEADSYTVEFDPYSNTYSVVVNVLYGMNVLDANMFGGSSLYVVNAIYQDTGDALVCISFDYG